jgi:DHA1 family bicyclomycin/chloramphenicol resistance-like MFS transporter
MADSEPHLSPPSAAAQRAPLAMIEFVPMVASLMALGSFGVDAMLPALPALGAQLGALAPGTQQYVISIYLLGLGIGQVIHGPLSDHFGRRPVMAVALVIYGICNLLAALAGSFVLLLAARFVAAIAVAATRVVTIAIVRDCFAGRPMARIMSLTAIVFMIAPVLAPTIGQGVLLLGSWRLIFALIAAMTAIVTPWFWLRLPETLAPENHAPVSVRRIAQGWRLTLTDRTSLGYMLASCALQGALYGYITSVQPVVATTFSEPRRLNVVFACTAGMMALASLINSRLVMRLGSRFLSHTALVVLIVTATTSLWLGLSNQETLLDFVALQAIAMGCFSLANANFSAMAMSNMGAIAGTASSVQGFFGMTIGAIVGAGIGESFSGTTTPIHVGFVSAGLIAFTIVAVTERGRMFRPA